MSSLSLSLFFFFYLYRSIYAWTPCPRASLSFSLSLFFDIAVSSFMPPSRSMGWWRAFARPFLHPCWRAGSSGLLKSRIMFPAFVRGARTETFVYESAPLGFSFNFIRRGHASITRRSLARFHGFRSPLRRCVSAAGKITLLAARSISTEYFLFFLFFSFFFFFARSYTFCFSKYTPVVNQLRWQLIADHNE